MGKSKPKLDSKMIASLIKEPGVGDIFVEKIKEIKDNQEKRIDDYQDFSDKWLSCCKGTEKDLIMAWCRKKALKIMEEDLDKEIGKWKILLTRHLGVKREISSEFGQQLEELKAVPIENMVNLEKQRQVGSKIIACCPLHNEKTPSFVIYTESNSWCCYGQCGKAGDNIAFIQAYYDVNFKDALKIISQYA